MSDAFAPPRVDRRTWVKGSLSVGFCAAISPVFGQTIATPSEGLIAGEVKFSAGDVDIPAYRAMPDGGGKFPTVLVIHEIFGVHEHIKDVCRRWAKLGYYAIAPELFARQGDAAAEKDMQKLMADIVAKKPDSRGSERSRRDGRLRQGERVGRPGPRRRDRILLGRAADVALCGA